MLELESLEALDAHLAAGRPFRGVVLQGLDLRRYSARLAALDLRGAVFLGCRLGGPENLELQAGGAMVFPEIPGLPFHPYRGALYTVEELYAGFDPARPESYGETLDGLVYAPWKATGGVRPKDIVEDLARRLHDHAMTDALDELLAACVAPVVAVMGGHGMARDGADYARVAELGRAMARRGMLVATGGGPGAMEAAHLGTYLAGAPDAALSEALALLAAAPRYDDPGWLPAAFAVREAFPPAPAEVPALGIPTWLYGHEPPNAFATHHAKFFQNAIREEGLLTIAEHGIVFAPGSAGTIQEVFQDACQNHYRVTGSASPMVFLGVEYWRDAKPVYPLLEGLAAGRDYHAWLRLTDSLEEVLETLEEYAGSLAS